MKKEAANKQKKSRSKLGMNFIWRMFLSMGYFNCILTIFFQLFPLLYL